MKWVAKSGKDSILEITFEGPEDFLHFVQTVVIPMGRKYGFEIKLSKIAPPKEPKIPIVKP